MREERPGVFERRQLSSRLTGSTSFGIRMPDARPHRRSSAVYRCGSTAAFVHSPLPRRSGSECGWSGAGAVTVGAVECGERPTTRVAPEPSGWWHAILAWALVTVALAAFRLVAGHDLNSDGRNYHYYNAFAFVHGSSFENVVPARVQTYLNPLPLLPFFFATTLLPPRLASLAMVAMEALSSIFVFLLCRQVLARHVWWPLALGATFLGMTSAVVLSEAGTSLADLGVALPLVAAVFFATRAVGDDARNYDEGLAGLLAGAAVGLKWSEAPFALALGLALAIVRIAPARLVRFAAGGVLGYLVAGGWWDWLAYREVGSLAFLPERLADRRFLSPEILDFVTLPFLLAIGTNATGELPMQDPRWLLCLVLVVAAAATSAKLAPCNDVRQRPYRLLLCFALVSY